MSAGVFWAGAILGAAFGLILAEVADVSAWVAPKLVRSAAKRMPTAESRERYSEEWLAELAAFNGLKLIKLGKAISLWLNSWRLCRVIRIENGYVSSRVYVRRLYSAAIWSSKAAWHGVANSKGAVQAPSTVLYVFSAKLMLEPLGGPKDVDVRADGKNKITITASSGDVDVTPLVVWLLPVTRVFIVVLVDFYFLRRRKSFREMRRANAYAWRQVRKMRAEESVAVPSDRDGDQSLPW